MIYSNRYYALELCAASLDKLFLNDGNPDKYCGPDIPVEDMLIQLASGLEYIHRMELVHRDLKPENALIWVDNEKQIAIMKWADFGLSKPTSVRGTFTLSGIKGTPYWFAPEILQIWDAGNKNESAVRSRGTNKSDVFAEGLILGYILLGGEHPYGDTLFKTLSNLKENNAVNLPSISVILQIRLHYDLYTQFLT